MTFLVLFKGKRTGNTVRREPLKHEAEEQKHKRDVKRTKAVKSANKKQPIKKAILGKTAGRTKTPKFIKFDL